MARSLSQVTCPPFLCALSNAANIQHTEWTAFSISIWCTYTYLLAMLHLPFQSLKSSLLFSAASYCPLSAESEAQLFLFQSKKKKKKITRLGTTFELWRLSVFPHLKWVWCKKQHSQHIMQRIHSNNLLINCNL